MQSDLSVTREIVKIFRQKNIKVLLKFGTINVRDYKITITENRVNIYFPYYCQLSKVSFDYVNNTFYKNFDYYYNVSQKNQKKNHIRKVQPLI